MTLDNEQQRKFLLNAVTSVQVQGNVDQIRSFVTVADEVIKAITEAKVVKFVDSVEKPVTRKTRQTS